MGGMTDEEEEFMRPGCRPKKNNASNIFSIWVVEQVKQQAEQMLQCRLYKI
jgi:hypothetical protein